MIKKINSINYVFAFLLSLLSTYYFFFKDIVGDSYSYISISNIESGFFTYAWNSVLFLVGYYVGPWIAFSFFISAIVTAIFSKKITELRKVLFFYSSLVSMLFFCIIFMKSSVGEGLSNYLNYLGWFVCFLFALSSIVLSIFLVSGKSTTEAKEQILLFFERAVEILRNLKNRNEMFVSEQEIEEVEMTYENDNVEAEDSRIERVKPSYTADPYQQVPEQLQLPVLVEYKNIDETKPAPRESTVRANTHQYAMNDYLKSIVTKNKKIFEDKADEKYFAEISNLIEEKLSEFNIVGKIINVLKGPVVDTFELELGAGVKVSKINSIVEDLGLALSGAPIRLVYPLKGRTTLGVEVPRNPREIIYLDEVLQDKTYTDSSVRLPVAMGRDAFGESFIVDLASMPHMLVAGATGAGKSVFINTLLVSLLVKLSPEKLKLILIDPKQLELALYSNLPHLILPVITEAKMASASLLWAVQEMERRYSILKEFAVRNIDGFNKKLSYANANEIEKIQRFYGDEKNLELPYVVVIVDEFADLILSKSGKEIETNICRLAAKARAAGIHLVIATQRPSVDVITGLIKSNFPTRVSFRVTTNIDSRTILSAMGAEKLLGMGDMLYKNGIDMSRLHSAYISEEEIEKLMDKLSLLPKSIDQEALEFVENGGEENSELATLIGLPSEGGGVGDDLLYREAVKIAAENRVASASMLQRRLRIGYNRAANLIEEMERKGVVGPQQGSKPRKVLISSDEAQSIS